MSDKTRDALEFYRLEAEALARYMAEGKENKADAILASVTVLSLDGGSRAREVLHELEQLTREVKHLKDLVDAYSKMARS